MKKMTLMTLLTLVLNTAFADGIICSQDARPVDGNYQEVKLFKNQDGYQLVKKTITAGFGFPVEEKETILATNLKCNIQGVIAYCFKSQTESSDRSNSIVTFKEIDKRSLYSLKQKDVEQAPTQIEIKVGSPLVKPLRETFNFLKDHRLGGCREI